MPARVRDGTAVRTPLPTAPAPTTTLGRTLRASQMASTSAQRPVKATRSGSSVTASGRLAQSKATTAPSSKTQQSCGDDDDASLLASLTSASKCRPETVQAMLFTLDVTVENLSLSLMHRSDSRGGLSSTSRKQRASPASPSSNLGASDLASKSSGRTVLFAKQAVNNIIVAFNDLVTSGWKASNGGRTSLSTSSTPESSRPASAIGREVASASTKKTTKPKSGVSPHNTALPTDQQSSERKANGVSNSRVTIMFDCLRIAIRYLILRSTSSTGIEIDKIVVSVIRKLIALDMYHAADAELSWMRTDRYRTHFAQTSTSARGSSFSVVISDDIESSDLVALLLDVQALSFVSALSLATSDSLRHFLDASLTDPDGPLQVQSGVRRRQSAEVDSKIVDRSAYTVERAIMRKASTLHDDAASPSSTSDTFACRAASLRFLLIVSDLDLDAFWDRVTRVGVSHFRAQSAISTRQEAFAEVDDLFKQLLEQNNERRGSSGSTKGFKAFTEAWTGMARKASNVDAMRFIEQQLYGHSVSQTSLDLPTDDADSHLARCCSSIAIADAALEQAAVGEHKETVNLDVVLRGALGDIESATSVLGSASLEAKTRILREGGNIRRRCCSLLALKEDGQDWREVCLQLLIATAVLSRAFLLNGGSAGDAMVAENALSDYVQAKRFAAKVIFDGNTRESHEQSAAHLEECSSAIEEANGTLLKAKLLQSLASSWQYAGAQLYAQKLAAVAVRFLRRSVELAEQSHTLFTAARLDGVEMDEQTAEAMLQQAANLPKRFEHLGVCYRLTARPALADAAYRKAVSFVDPAVWTQMESAATGAVPSTASATNEDAARPLTDAAHLVKVAFEIEAFDLLSLSTGQATIFDDLKAKSVGTGALSNLLEHCLASVEESMHRDEASLACKTLLDLLIDSYPVEQFPLRRCRALLRKLEVDVLQMATSKQQEEMQNLIKEIEAVLSAPTVTTYDCHLEVYRAQHRASFALLRALAAHNAGDSGTGTVEAQVESYVDDAMLHLRSLVVREVPSCDKVESAGAGSKQRTLRATSAPRQAKERNLSTALHPKTPPNRQKAPSTLSKAATRVRREETGVVVASSTACPVLNIKRLLQLMELVQEMEVAHGLILQSVELAEIARDLCLRSDDPDDNAKETYLRCSSALVRQLLSLGKERRAKSTLDEVHAQLDQWGSANDDARARMHFAEAEYHCQVGETAAAKAAFDKAVDLAEHVDPHARTSGMQSAMEKALLVERQSIAFCVHAHIQVSSGEASQGMLSAVNAIKAAMRGGMMLAKLTRGGIADGTLSDTQDSPFDSVNSKKDAGPVVEEVAESGKPTQNEQRQPQRTVFTSRSLGILYWRMVKALRQAYYCLSWLHTLRGSVRDAEAFTTECVDFAAKAQCSHALATALVDRGCLLLRMGKVEQAAEDIERATVHVEASKASKLRAALAFLCGDRCLRLGALSQARQYYDEGWSELAKIDTALDWMKIGRSGGGGAGESMSLSTVHRTILQRKAWLTHVMQEEDDEGCVAMMEQARQSYSETGEMDVMLGKIGVRQALSELRKDQLLSLATEAALSLPSAVVALPVTGTLTASRTGGTAHAASTHLARSLVHFQDVMGAAGSRCTSSVALGEAMVYSMLSQTLVANLPLLSATSMVDAATQHTVRAFTLEHELIDSIQNKVEPSRDAAGKAWPRFGTGLGTLDTLSTTTKSRRTLAAASHKTFATKHRAITTDEGSSESEQDVDERAFWRSVRELRGPNARRPALPQHWTVVSIALARERNALVITRERRQGEGEPVVFSIPIDRQMRREGEESTTLGIDDVLGAIREIVEESNTATHAAQHLDGLDARKAWWLRRRELDERLKAQLCAIEATWLGAFKSLLLPVPTSCSASSLDGLRTALRDVLAKACFPTASAASALQLSPVVIDTLCAGLDPAQCTDEDLEDVVHFVMDAYQLQGTPVAIDEVDLDQCVTDVRGALEAFRSRAVQGSDDNNNDGDDEHLFLILDKDLCAVPWESLPCLRGRAVCRVPSMSFLYDRLLMAPDGRFTVKAATAKQYYLLNPSQELMRTQDRFLPHFEGARTSSDNAQADGGEKRRGGRWRGLAGRAPTLDEFGRALETNDVVLYFGHGGAEQFVRASRLRGMLRCAVTMLWGCSSAVLRDMGDFDRTGTPYNYLLAGCPSLVGNLWDATDKELDGVCESTLRRLGMIGDDRRHASIAQAVAQSRDACKLPYLTGAACVVYGVPVYYEA